MPRRVGPRAAQRLTALALLLVLAGAGGCAYFNTFSNAKRAFHEAERTPLAPDGRVTPSGRKAYDTCVEKCKKLLELYPESKWVDDTLYLMSRAYFGKAEYGSCLRRLDDLDERFPEHRWQEPALYMRGVCLLEDGDEASAIATLERLQERYPRSKHLAEGMYRRGEAEYRLGNWAAATAAYRRLLESLDESDFHDAARLKIAMAQRELGQDSLAVTSLADLAAVGRDRRKVFEGQLTAAEILLEQRRLAECGKLLEELEPIAENFQSRAQVLLLKARLTEIEERHEESVILFENVATEFPRSNPAAEAWYRIGLIRQNRQGDLAQAIQAYDQATKEVPRSLFGDLAVSKRRAAQEVIDVQARFGAMPADSLGAEREALQFRLAENQFLRLDNPQQAQGEYARLLVDHPESAFAPQAAYAVAYISRYSLADSAVARWAVALLLERYSESEAASFVAAWPALLGPGPATAPVLPPPSMPAPAVPAEPGPSDLVPASESAPLDSAAPVLPVLPAAAPRDSLPVPAPFDSLRSPAMPETLGTPAASDSLETPQSTAPPEGSDEP